MKKVYFACSISGGRNDADIYEKIVGILKTNCQLLSEIFADQKLTSLGMNKPEKHIYKTDMSWIHQADCVVAEVSTPSLGVGYEIAKAELLKKPILCLYRNQPGKKLSAMIAGSPHVTVLTYDKVDEIFAPLLSFVSP